MTITPSELRSRIARDVKTGNGVAYVVGTLQMPDPMLAELFDDVAAAKAKYEATVESARDLIKRHRKAVDARGAHKQNDDAVYTSTPENGLVFSDARGVELQNAVRDIDRELSANGSKSKAALADYLTLAIIRGEDAKDEALARALAADDAAHAAAEALVAALTERERYWGLAGQPMPNLSEDRLTSAPYERVLLQIQRQADLRHAIDRALPFPNLRASK